MGMTKKGFSVIILAAGKGTRMKSPLPKVLHPTCGQPMIRKVITEYKKAGGKEIRVVLGFGQEIIRPIIEPMGVFCFVQKDQLGTADAVKAAEPSTLSGTVVIANGDHPLVHAKEIENLVNEFENSSLDLAVVSSKIKNPYGLGRIVRDSSGKLQAIVEEKDASHESKRIREINSGMYLVRGNIFEKILPLIDNNNQQKEYYLTDLVSLSISHGKSVDALCGSRRVSFGVNSQMELAQANKFLFRQKAKDLMDSGVMFLDPNNTYIEDSVTVKSGTLIYPGVHLKGNTHIGKGCTIGPNSFIEDSEILDSVQILSGTIISNSRIESLAQLGPYSHIRPQTKIGKEAKVGNFVELKKVNFGDGAKASHLTYLGDAEIGENTNIGCGTITCNYEKKKKKYVTKIGKNVFVGSDSQFVAPLTVGDGAVIGSGSTITKDVPANSLAVSRSKQVIKEDYATLLKNKSNESKDK